MGGIGGGIKAGEAGVIGIGVIEVETEGIEEGGIGRIEVTGTRTERGKEIEEEIGEIVIEIAIELTKIGTTDMTTESTEREADRALMTGKREMTVNEVIAIATERTKTESPRKSQRGNLHPNQPKLNIDNHDENRICNDNCPRFLPFPQVLDLTYKIF